MPHGCVRLVISGFAPTPEARPVGRAAGLTLAGTAGAWPFKHSGRWSGPTEMGATAVHTALLPSSTPGQSVIFWWHASPAGAPMVAGGRILWQSVDDTICAVVPSANFDFHADVTNPGFDIC